MDLNGGMMARLLNIDFRNKMLRKSRLLNAQAETLEAVVALYDSLYWLGPDTHGRMAKPLQEMVSQIWDEDEDDDLVVRSEL